MLRETDAVSLIRNWLNVSASKYWNRHYRFNEVSGFRRKQLGISMIDNIIINTAVPVIFTYGNYHQLLHQKEKALDWLESTPAENNSIVKEFASLGIGTRSAYDTQALLEMKNEYCNKKRCLDCSVGNYLLKKPQIPVSESAFSSRIPNPP